MTDDKQFVMFVFTKGIRNLEGSPGHRRWDGETFGGFTLSRKTPENCQFR